MPREEIIGTILEAKVSEDFEGIVMKIRSNNRDIYCKATTQEQWLKIPVGKNPQKELQKVCDLLTGYNVVDGEKIPITGFVHKQVKIIKE